MQSEARRRYTEDEYLALERAAETKSELVRGEIVARPSTGPRHNVLAMNVAAYLLKQVQGRKPACHVFMSDQRLRVDATTYAYPDVSVTCGARFHEKHTDSLVNPTVLVEILSASTEGYDRGDKFAYYETIPSFVEYVLVSQRQQRIEHFRRIKAGQWLMTVLKGEAAVLELSSLGCSVPLEEIYAYTDQVGGDDMDGFRLPRGAG